MRTFGGFLLAAGALTAAWSLLAFCFLVVSPDSDWVTGLEYSVPLLVGGVASAVVGHRLRVRHGERAGRG